MNMHYPYTAIKTKLYKSQFGNNVKY